MVQREEDIADVSELSKDDSRQMLLAFRDNGFDGSQEAAGLAPGRESGDIGQMMDGSEEVDDDLIMKLKGIAHERGFEID